LAKTVLFDLDDTLFDHQYCSRSGLIALQARHAGLCSKPLADLQAEHLRLLNETHVQVMQGALLPLQARVERLRRLFAWCGEDVAEDVADEAAGIYRQAYEAARRAVPGSEPLLRALRARGVKIAIVTNNFVAEQQEKLVDVMGARGAGIRRVIWLNRYGLTCPDPTLAVEVTSLEPVEKLMGLLDAHLF